MRMSKQMAPVWEAAKGEVRGYEVFEAGLLTNIRMPDPSDKFDTGRREWIGRRNVHLHLEDATLKR